MLSGLPGTLLVCFKDNFPSFANKRSALVLEAYQNGMVLHNKNPLLQCYQYEQFSHFQCRWYACHVILNCFPMCFTKMASYPGWMSP